MIIDRLHERSRYYGRRMENKSGGARGEYAGQFCHCADEESDVIEYEFVGNGRRSRGWSVTSRIGSTLSTTLFC